MLTDAERIDRAQKRVGELLDENAALRADVERLREAATKALNYIANCESDFDVTLASGDALRAALGAS